MMRGRLRSRPSRPSRCLRREFQGYGIVDSDLPFCQLHAELPRLIVEINHRVYIIDNPDDDLESLLTYLAGGRVHERKRTPEPLERHGPKGPRYR